MRLTRRKRCRHEMTDDERAKLAEARQARESAQRLLAETVERGPEVEHMVAWLKRARAENHFSQRIAHMLQNPGEESPWP